MDLRIGGPFELYFGGPDVPHDQRGSNGCQVLTYVPGEMLSFTWNAPPKATPFCPRRSLTCAVKSSAD